MSTHRPWLLALFLSTIACAEAPIRPCAASIPFQSCSWQDEIQAVQGNVTSDLPDHNALLNGRHAAQRPAAMAASDDLAIHLVSTSKVSAKHFQWKRALQESFTFLLIEQAYVIHGDFGWVVSENGIPFNHYWRDYTQSLSAWTHSGWNDGDPNWYGYVGHPIQGALTGFIQIQNDPQGERLEFSKTRAYWWSRFKSFWWNAAYSTQWNLGPLSEVTVEKYGTKDRPPWNYSGSWPCYKHCVTGVGQIDIVMTPLGGTGWLIGEDFLDKFVVRRVERRTTNRFLIDAARLGLNPIRGGANFLHGQVPWYRASRDKREMKLFSGQGASALKGEVPGEEFPEHGDVFIGYSHLGPPHCQATLSHNATGCDLLTNQIANLGGWNASVEKKYLRYFGAVAAVGGQYGTASQNSFFFGIRGSAPLRRFRPFAQALVGAVHAQESLAGASKSDTAFAEILGAGVDVRLKRLLSWRIEADELESALFGIKRHSNLLSSGPVIRF